MTKSQLVYYWNRDFFFFLNMQINYYNNYYLFLVFGCWVISFTFWNKDILVLVNKMIRPVLTPSHQGPTLSTLNQHVLDLTYLLAYYYLLFILSFNINIMKRRRITRINNQRPHFSISDRVLRVSNLFVCDA